MSPGKSSVASPRSGSLLTTEYSETVAGPEAPAALRETVAVIFTNLWGFFTTDNTDGDKVAVHAGTLLSIFTCTEVVVVPPGLVAEHVTVVPAVFADNVVIVQGGLVTGVS